MKIVSKSKKEYCVIHLNPPVSFGMSCPFPQYVFSELRPFTKNDMGVVAKDVDVTDQQIGVLSRQFMKNPKLVMIEIYREKTGDTAPPVDSSFDVCELPTHAKRR